MTDDGAQDLREENDRLRAALRVVTDDLASLLDTGKFPPRGRSGDDKNSAEGWWEDRAAHVGAAYAALAGKHQDVWRSAHPGLYPGPWRDRPMKPAEVPMATISPTQLTYLARIRDAAVDGLVPAQDVFDKLRASKLSIGRMIEAGVIAKTMVGGRSHYQITAAGRALLPSQSPPPRSIGHRVRAAGVRVEHGPYGYTLHGPCGNKCVVIVDAKGRVDDLRVQSWLDGLDCGDSETFATPATDTTAYPPEAPDDAN